jgi:spore maturation protein CgeB
MAGNDRGNMRCIEAMGCGAVMVSDAGNYPEGMIDGRTMFTCKDAEDTVRVVEGVLALPDQGRSVAAEGLRLVRERYSKAAQWKRFQHLVENK